MELPRDSARLARAMAALATAYGRGVSDAMAEVYALALGDLDIGAVETAVRRAITEDRAWPAPARLRELAGVDKHAEAERAWAVVLEAVRGLSRHQRVSFGPRATECVRQLGGWLRLLDLGGDQLHTWAHRAFVEAWQRSTEPVVGPCEPLDAEDVWEIGGHADWSPRFAALEPSRARMALAPRAEGGKDRR